MAATLSNLELLRVLPDKHRVATGILIKDGQCPDPTDGHSPSLSDEKSPSTPSDGDPDYHEQLDTQKTRGNHAGQQALETSRFEATEYLVELPPEVQLREIDLCLVPKDNRFWSDRLHARSVHGNCGPSKSRSRNMSSQATSSRLTCCCVSPGVIRATEH